MERDKLIIAKLKELIAEYEKLVKFCEAPQFHEIMTAKAIQKTVIISVLNELSALEKEVPEEKCIVAKHNFICDDKGITTCKDCHLTINYPFE